MFRRRLLFNLVIAAVSVYIAYDYNAVISSTPIKSLTTFCAEKLAFFSKNNFQSSVTNRRSEEKIAKKKKEIEASLMSKSPMIIGEMCSPNSDICYLIVDSAMKMKEEFVVKRSMVLKKNLNYALTIVDLDVPTELTWTNSNTKNWNINKLVITTRYIKVFIAAGFFMEALSFEPVEQQKVLMIGLGGGVASNFLSMLDWLMIHTTVVEIDAFVHKVARQYFEHTDELRTSVIIEDGVSFIKNAVENEEKYNLLLLDACHTDDEDILCPAEDFYTQNVVIKNIADILEKNGVFVINILCQKNVEANEEKMLKLYEPFFPSCYLLRYLSHRRLLICSKKPKWTWTEKRTQILQNLKKVDDIFEFKLYDILKNIE